MMTPPHKNDRAMTGTCLWFPCVQDGDRRTLCCSSACRTWEGPLSRFTRFIPALLFYVSMLPDKVEAQPSLTPVSSGLQCDQKNNNETMERNDCSFTRFQLWPLCCTLLLQHLPVFHKLDFLSLQRTVL